MSCETCSSCSPVRGGGAGAERLLALAGNPNTGKSTVFNRLTGLRQHTGNWPGKTITRAEGSFAFEGQRYRIVDLPGTYSLMSTSPDEEVAREFLLFGQSDVAVIVVDATALERNMNLVLQVLQICQRAVICLNMMDEARAHRMVIDIDGLAADLGVPVVPCAARSGRGVSELVRAVEGVLDGSIPTDPLRLALESTDLEEPVRAVEAAVTRCFPNLHNAQWVALRLLENDPTVVQRAMSGSLGKVGASGSGEAGPEALAIDPPEALATEVEKWRWRMPENAHDVVVESIYSTAHQLCAKHVRMPTDSRRAKFQSTADRLLTHPLTGFPLMLAIFAAVLWITIEGANVPSGLLSEFLLGMVHPLLKSWTGFLPWWMSGLLVDGMYLAAAWVVSVMLPPMAIFFPLFTILEDLGYLPRVALNLDRLFQLAGAHGKQALTMSMGLGCNAAGVIACRIIDSPRERLIAMITNNFSLCNGRWPTQILLATLFLGALVPPALAGMVAAGAVASVALLGFLLTFLTSWMLSGTVLRGHASTFSLELPPLRPPDILRTLYTSIIDRTLFVLWRAVVFAVPAGAAIWLIANITIGGQPLAIHASALLDPLGWVMGLSGLILLAYIVAIPANEIVVPTILMLTVLVTGQSAIGSGAGVMFEPEESLIREILLAGGWSTLTALCVMLFSLCHNPCSTTLFTIYKETKSWSWTAVSAALPLAIGFLLCSLVAALWRLTIG